MNKTQALRKAVKLFGKNATITDYRKPSSHEARAIASATRKELSERCNTPELKKANREELDRLLFASIFYRYNIGKIEMGMFNAIKACGDSWEGCFRAMAQSPQSGTAHEQPEEAKAA